RTPDRRARQESTATWGNLTCFSRSAVFALCLVSSCEWRVTSDCHPDAESAQMPLKERAATTFWKRRCRSFAVLCGLCVICGLCVPFTFSPGMLPRQEYQTCRSFATLRMTTG